MTPPGPTPAPRTGTAVGTGGHAGRHAAARPPRDPRPTGRADPTGPGRARPPRSVPAAGALAAARRCRDTGAATPPVGPRSTLVVVDSFAALALRPLSGGGVVLARRGTDERPLHPGAAKVPGLRAVTLGAGGATAVRLTAGTSTALVVARPRPGCREALVALVAGVVLEVAAAHVDLAAPDLWASHAAGRVLAGAVAETADSVRAGAASFALDARDGVGTWMAFAGICSPSPAGRVG